MSSHDGWKIGGWKDDDPAADILTLEATRKLQQSQLAFVFVAMIAGNEENCGPRALMDAYDRDRQPAIGRFVPRQRQSQETALLARLGEVDFGQYAAHYAFSCNASSRISVTGLARSGSLDRGADHPRRSPRHRQPCRECTPGNDQAAPRRAPECGLHT